MNYGVEKCREQGLYAGQSSKESITVIFSCFLIFLSGCGIIHAKPGLKGIELFSCSTQLCMKFILLKDIELFSCSTQMCMKFILLSNVKMQTIVGILTLIGSINDWLWSFKPEISAYLVITVFMSSLNFMLLS